MNVSMYMPCPYLNNVCYVSKMGTLSKKQLWAAFQVQEWFSLWSSRIYEFGQCLRGKTVCLIGRKLFIIFVSFPSITERDVWGCVIPQMLSFPSSLYDWTFATNGLRCVPTNQVFHFFVVGGAYLNWSCSIISSVSPRGSLLMINRFSSCKSFIGYCLVD